MKILVTVLLLTFATNLFAAQENIYLGRTTTLDLASIKTANKANLLLSYPGEISGMCGIELRFATKSDRLLKSILDKVVIKEALSDDGALVDVKIKNGSAFIELPVGGYLDGISIEALQNESISELILSTVGGYALVAIPTHCE